MDERAISFRDVEGLGNGCPLYNLSPSLFIISVEILAETIRTKRVIKGIKIQNTEIKVSQYADDTTMILYGTEEALRASLSTIETLGTISGLRLNSNKTEALGIGSKRNCDLKLCPKKKFKWPR